jgi:hypothetical protein
VKMNQGTAAVARKGPHHLPGRLLLLHMHVGAAFPRFEAQGETSR